MTPDGLSNGGFQAELRANGAVDFGRHVLVLLQERARGFAALPEALAGEAVPRSRLFDDTVFCTEVQKVAFSRDTFAIEDVDFGFTERRRDFVLHDLDPGAAANCHF